MYLYGIEILRRQRTVHRSFGSNCTFMELKFRQQTKERHESEVLIVPLWNWNCFYPEKVVPLQCSNCTFMELKFGPLFKMSSVPTVLIVPLWNWNEGYGHHRRQEDYVLIVPLWNWNGIFDVEFPGVCCSNCTFMELK